MGKHRSKKEKHGDRKSKRKGHSKSIYKSKSERKPNSTDSDSSNGMIKKKRKSQRVQKFSDSSSDGSPSHSEAAREDLSSQFPSSDPSNLKESHPAQIDSTEARQLAGLDWMTAAPAQSLFSKPKEEKELVTEDPEKQKVSSRELNPHWTSGEGTGFPPEAQSQLETHRPTGVGDGGASWRLKALKRAKEQAAREGKQLSEVVKDRWGSLSDLTAGIPQSRSFQQRDASQSSGGHRERGVREEEAEGGRNFGGERKRAAMRAPRADASLSWRKSRSGREEEEIRGSSGGRESEGRRGETRDVRKAEREGGVEVVEASGGRRGGKEESFPPPPSDLQETAVPATQLAPLPPGAKEEEAEAAVERRDAPSGVSVASLTSNQVAAKVMKLRLMGKGEEAEELLRLQKLKEEKKEEQKEEQSEERLPPVRSARAAVDSAVGGTFLPASVAARLASADVAARQRPQRLDRYEAAEDGDGEGRGGRGGRGGGLTVKARYFADDDDRDLLSLVAEERMQNAANGGAGAAADWDARVARSVVRNKAFKSLTSADDEYDHDMGLEAGDGRQNKKKRKKTREEGSSSAWHLQQQHRAGGQSQHASCPLCFERPDGRRLESLVAIATKSYLMLPPRGAMLPGHCYICTMQHEGATRSVEDDVWEEVRNFKKCLVKMFAEEGKEALFLETAMSLSSRKQRQHCHVEAIPVPADLTRDAPLYFKKAIDEAETEWSQHDSKKLIDTRGKGLRSSIPKNFPYFHVEFGLQGGYCHVIDDERKFKASFGRDVVSGMLELPPEDSYKRHKMDPVSKQQQSLSEFVKKWSPHDWTKMLD